MKVFVTNQRLRPIIGLVIESEIVEVTKARAAEIRGDVLSISWVRAVQQNLPVWFDPLCAKCLRQNIGFGFVIAVKPTGWKVDCAR